MVSLLVSSAVNKQLPSETHIALKDSDTHIIDRLYSNGTAAAGRESLSLQLYDPAGPLGRGVEFIASSTAHSLASVATTTSNGDAGDEVVSPLRVQLTMTLTLEVGLLMVCGSLRSNLMFL